MSAKDRKRVDVAAVDRDEILAGAQYHARHVQSNHDEELRKGLRLQPSKKVHISELQESSHNSLFDSAKSEDYWNELRQDILNAGAILEPLIATRDGILISGHSRLQIARELVTAGDERFQRVSVCYVIDELTEDDRRERVYRSNLLRFEVDEDLRIRIHSELYPQVYRPLQKGRPADTSETETIDGVVKKSGLSRSTIKRERRIFQAAVEIALADMRDSPEKADFQAARARENAGRKKAKAPEKHTPSTSARVKPLSPTRLQQLKDQFISQRASDVDAALIHEFVDFLLASSSSK